MMPTDRPKEPGFAVKGLVSPSEPNEFTLQRIICYLQTSASYSKNDGQLSRELTIGLKSFGTGLPSHRSALTISFLRSFGIWKGNCMVLEGQ